MTYTSAQLLAVGPIPNLKAESFVGNSGWVTSEADEQGNLYVAFEHVYATDGLCPAGGCYAVTAGKSRDNGRNWELQTIWASTSSSIRRPSLTVDSSGRLYIAAEFYYNAGSGYRWYPARVVSTCPREVSAWAITYYNTTYALIPGATSADAGGDGDDVYLEYQVAYQADALADVYTLFSTDGGGSWTGHYLQSTSGALELPTLSVGSANVVATFLNGGARDFYYGAIGGGPSTYTGTSQDNATYADADGSGSYHYVAYQRNNRIRLRYSTNDGLSFSGEVNVDTANNTLYPAVSANGQRVRVAYTRGGNRTQLRTSDNNGANWSSAYTLNTAGDTTVAAFHNVALAFHPIGGAADGKHPMVFWVDDRDRASQGDNIYLGTINDPPNTPTPAWPADGATVTAFAPSLRWDAASDPDGDLLRYHWYADTVDGSTRVGGPITMLSSLPYETAPETTYYWQVIADDGYQLSASAGVQSFTVGSESFSGSPATFAQAFTTDPSNWTRESFALLDSFESTPLGWDVSPAGAWERSSNYAWDGAYSARALYDANNADYQITSPALDLRGSAWAYFGTHFTGSSESGYDFLYLQSRPDSASACWTTEDTLSGDYSAGWWHYYAGAIDLSAYAGTDTGQVRFRFTTDSSNYGGSYGLGWYVDDVQVLRESAWTWDGSGFYRLQASQGGWTGYPDNVVDQLYSPYVQLPSPADSSLRLRLSERYNVATGDAVAVWILDVAAGTWEQLAARSGNRGTWGERSVTIPDSYKGKIVALSFVLQSDDSGTLLSRNAGKETLAPQESGGYWDLDDVLLEDYDPTAVTLAGFDAQPVANGIRLAWETVSEVDALGFNLYRSEAADGDYVRLTATPIPAQNPGGLFGAAYTWVDTAVRPGTTYYYRLEGLGVDGTGAYYGPVAVMASGETVRFRTYLPLVLEP